MPIGLSLVALALTAGISVGSTSAKPSPRLRAATLTAPSGVPVNPSPAMAIDTVRPSADLAVPTGAFAPQARGSIRGDVTDQQGGHMPGVTITVEPVAAEGPRRTAMSDASGQFAVINLPDGTYLLTAALSGFRRDLRRVEIVSGGALTEVIQLRVGSLTEEIHVSSTSPNPPRAQQIQPSTASVADLLDAAKQAADAGRLADAESAIRQALAALQAARPQPHAPGGPVVVGGDIREPKRTRYIEPVYPKAARDAGIQGTVVIEATIDRNGSVADALVVRGVPELNDAALTAMRQWAYTPTLLAGVPVEVLMTVTVVFSAR
jgi:TonB family protein